MGELEVMPLKLKLQISSFQKLERELNDIKTGISEVKGNLYLKNSYSYNIKRTLQQINDETQSSFNHVKTLGGGLSEIVKLYEQTEKEISGSKNNLKVIPDALPASNISMESQEGDKPEFWNNFKSNLGSDVAGSFLKSSGAFLGRFAGEINILTSVARSSGENAFVIINPNVAETTAAMVKGGNALKAGAKYGLPIIGAIIDFAAMKFSGESTQDAFVKTGAHVGIGLAGAKIGAVVGSVIPGAGTVAGAAIGFVAGAAITTVGNMVFDYVYDNWDDVVSGVQKATDYVADKVNDVVSGIGDAFSDIGNAICSPFQSLGALFG